MKTKIHPTAAIASSAEIGEDVEIGPYSVVGPQVRIGDRTRIGAQVVLDGVLHIGEENVIVGQASLGGAPQDLSYQGEPTRLEIGHRNTIREFVTINRGTIKGGGVTRVGSDCLLMACSHVAHDCELRDRVILANNVLLAGHVLVGEQANISGGAAAHHFVTVGDYAYVGGMSRMIQDVPPYMIMEGHRPRVRGVNVIGLQRGNFSHEEIECLRDAFRKIFREAATRSKSLVELKADPATHPHVLNLVKALENTSLGAKGRYRESLRETFARAGRELIEGGVAT
jgi:UDP-N-acetylglucosamine acyltransferase